MSKPILISACLAGIYCRYDGETKADPAIVELVKQGLAIPFCPEAHGGLPTPRLPCEIRDGRVVNIEGGDQTEQFVRGAQEGLRLAKLVGATKAILKSNSPSCGKGFVYDGTFTSTRVKGNGLFAELLMQNGIDVRSDDEF